MPFADNQDCYETREILNAERIPWPDPTPGMLEDPYFNAIWDTIKGWDIAVPMAYRGYEGATGNHVRAILDALTNARAKLAEASWK